MFYLWLMPLVLVAVTFTWVLYLVCTRGLPKISSRSVEDALAQEQAEDGKTKVD